MTNGREPQHASRQRAAEAVRELAILEPFSIDAFRVRLQRYCDRRIEVRPVVTDVGAPPGLWLRTAAADYLYYESQTSPFHQACILLQLAASILLGDGPGMRIDPRLVPDLSPELIRAIVGDDAEVSEAAEDETEALMFEAMKHAQSRPPVRTARRLHHQLRPLHAALLEAVPEAERTGVPDRPGPRVRLHRAVAEIREAELALRPYVDPHLGAAGESALMAGLAGDDLAAAMEAAVLRQALHAKAARTPAPHAGRIPGWLHSPGPGLRREGMWLARVARAFARDSQASAGGRGASPGRLPDGVAMLADRAGRGRARGDWISP